MSTHNDTVVLAPNGCPLETHPQDPGRLFSANGLNLDLPRIGWIGSGILTIISTGISFALIWRHLQYYHKPNQQRYIVRMLLMVPIYGITSWFSFVYVREAVYYETIRILYEAFVIASFLILMLQYLGETRADQKRVLRTHKKTERWFFPMCCLKYNPSRPHFLQYMKWGILQYIPLSILGCLLTVILNSQGWYCESSWNPKFGHVWILVISTTAVTIATYFLIMFYFTVRHDLKQYDPFYKFLAVKLVIFFSFWQMVTIEGFVYFGYITATTYWSTNDISVGINAVLIDIEMVFFALMHLKAFSYKPYVPRLPNPELAQPAGNTTADPTLDSVHPHDRNKNKDAKRLSNANSLSSLFSDPDNVRGTKAVDTTAPSSAHGKQDMSKKGKTDKKGKDGKMIVPDSALDFTQKTPVWKGLIDSFNPLDTLRELGYAAQYMYRWSRGIPVDKDSRRLLDLENAFGRQRPEVPYVPPKKKKGKEDDKKKKKKDKKGKDDETDESDDDDDKGDDDGKRSGSEDGGKDGDYYDDKDAAGGAHDRDKDIYHREPGTRPQAKWRADGTFSGDVGIGSGRDKVTDAREQFNVVRKPVPPVSSTGVGPSGEDKGTSRKEKIRYLEKDEAARTELATLPDIKLEPIKKKVAMSGLYADLPLQHPDLQSTSSASSLDIPIPMAMPAATSRFRDAHGQWQQRQEYHRQDLDRDRPGYSRSPLAPAPGRSGYMTAGGGLTQLANRNFVSKGDPYRQDADHIVDFEDGAGAHQRLDSEATSILSTSTSGQFYHFREGSRSDPELRHYGLDHEHYLEQLRYLEEEQAAARIYHERLQQPTPQHQRHPSSILPIGPKDVPAGDPSTATTSLVPRSIEPVPPPDPNEQDPIVAEYNQIQHRQQVIQQQQEQEREQRGKEQREEEARRREEEERHRSVRFHGVPRRRNSLDSMSSDNSRGRIGDRRYERDYGPPRQPYAQPSPHHRQQQQGYQRPYRYPMQLPQPTPPAQFYRLPEESYLSREPYLPPSRGHYPPPSSTFHQQHRHHRPQEYSRPAYDDYSWHYAPPQPYSYQPPHRGQNERRDGEGWSAARHHPSPDPPLPSAPYKRDHRDGTPPEILFPASRYAAPFLRDYEYQQREVRRRTTQSPPPTRSDHPGHHTEAPVGMHPRAEDAGRGRDRTSYIDDGQIQSGSRRFDRPIPPSITTSAQSKALGGGMMSAPAGPMSAQTEYEEAIVWTRPPQPPLP